MNRGQDIVGRRDRDHVNVEALVLRADGARLSARLTNVSDEGCRLETDEMLKIGEHISIALPRMGNVRAQVRWALSGAAGTQFLDDGRDG